MYSASSFRRRQLEPTLKRKASDGQFSGSLIRLGRDSNNVTMNTSRLTSDVVMVVMQGRGKNMDCIGIAMHNIRYPEVDLCEFVDSKEFTRLKTMINVYRAYDIVIQNGNEEKGYTKLLGESLITAFPDATLQSIGARYFNSEKGVKSAQSMMNKEVSRCSDKTFEQQLAFGAFSVLIKYIHETRFVYFRSKSLRIQEIAINDTCMIDFSSWESLEIVDIDDSNKLRKTQARQRRTLLSVLDNTVTMNGSRLLRSNVLQPSTSIDIIDSRLDAVSELNDQPQLRDKLRGLLSRAHELDRAMAMCIQTTASWTVQGAEANINQIINLYQTLKVVGTMHDVLADAKVKSALLVAKIEFLKDDRFEEMMTILEEKVCDQNSNSKKNSLALKNVKCFAIKEGVSINLDIARKAYLELLKKVDEIAEEELQDHFPQSNGAARLSYSQSRGFHYTFVSKDAQDVALPMNFSAIVRNRSTITFSSRKLVSVNDRIQQVVAEVFLASDIIVADIVEKLQTILPVLYYAMDALSTIDFLCSLAVYSFSRDTVRPLFGSSISVSHGRHPILDWASPDGIITNDICLTKDRRFGIITGPNMAGKSTYLKQIALLSIIAQTGCFIPAVYAAVPVFSRIFSRMGHNDELIKNKSAFAAEMRDASSILNYADEDSLVVMDELARSTSTEEGVSITYAICEKILNLKCYTLLATHFLDVSVLATHSTAVENYHFRIPSEGEEKSSFSKHKLMRGPYKGPLYGFELVELSTFPDSVISHASLLATHLRSQASAQEKDSDIRIRRLKIYAGRRMKEQVEFYMAQYGPEWKNQKEAVDKVLSNKKYLIDEIAKIQNEEET